MRLITIISNPITIPSGGIKRMIDAHGLHQPKTSDPKLLHRKVIMIFTKMTAMIFNVMIVIFLFYV